jgi:hypothetical protein
MELKEIWVPLTDAIAFQPAIVPVNGIGVMESFTHSCCLWIVDGASTKPSDSAGPCRPMVPDGESKALT